MDGIKNIKSPALRYHGSKFRLAKWVISFFPEHHTYVEPFGGGAGILLRKQRSYAEIYNDIDEDIVNFFRVIRDPELNNQLRNLCALTPYARAEFRAALTESADPVERARRTAVRAMMGFGSAGATQKDNGFSIDAKRKYKTVMDVWARYPDRLAAIGERFTGVLIENRPATQVMRQHDAESTLHNVDPPYLPTTRDKGGNRRYRHEMSEEDHIILLQELRSLQGYVVLSGYDSELYNDLLPEWHKSQTKSRISAGRGTKVNTECVWLNPQCVEQLARDLI
ncbi:DNA adenine methylase [Salmonella enterica subsp. enterica serovar Infantis]|uniref:DNA adenine methylase n=5 Tax=Salmonella enterica TaxID=28901 RepID=A0A734CBJ5_SALET|nr:DNA adenine methylase [Salmonella enterica]EAA0697377.1 DNA adenine methylase [Salmonella enterica subsp. enterica serovar Nottingham]EAW1941067.1 DNA adenine methylase [Salmonella enterica subsp. enterica]EBH9142942.1 DNA adenine methylase [Salmonella enterica subsp. enterica serovar Cerro]EBS4282293.1 DNA adenine methylase [Salmonella enterica subsp. enterica serovar Tennessee]EBS5153988.1 DNA adenine methylase [Salmonella enterica subsp. enterica serovar Monschaui]EBS5348021.1 DNA adeni